MSILFALLYYAATVILVVGLGFKIWVFYKTPAPLKIPTTPAPTTTGGVVLRMVREVTLFESLFKSTKWTWLFGWLFHFGLLLVLLRHLRYFTEPVWWWVDILQPFGKYASIAMVIGLVGLLGRRIFVDRVRYISAPSDFLMLFLLLGIGFSGMMMTFVSKVDIVALKTFFLGLMSFSIEPFPSHPILIIHLLLVASLMIIFPFSKLLHAPGVFFSPSRNQVDNPREKRHISDWAIKLESGDGK
ncbi:MAG: respiratory nitrate reductase subunit gamma [Thiotrichales bacterium]